MNVNDVKKSIQSLQNSLDDMKQNTDRLTRMQTLIKDIIKKYDYISEHKGQPLDYTEATNVRAAQEYLERNKITSPEDIEKLKAQFTENAKALSILKEKTSKAQARQNEYLRILDNYELVMNGDYIERLVQIEREKRAQQEQRK